MAASDYTLTTGMAWSAALPRIQNGEPTEAVDPTSPTNGTVDNKLGEAVGRNTMWLRERMPYVGVADLLLTSGVSSFFGARTWFPSVANSGATAMTDPTVTWDSGNSCHVVTWPTALKDYLEAISGYGTLGPMVQAQLSESVTLLTANDYQVRVYDVSSTGCKIQVYEHLGVTAIQRGLGDISADVTETLVGSSIFPGRVRFVQAFKRANALVGDVDELIFTVKKWASPYGSGDKTTLHATDLKLDGTTGIIHQVACLQPVATVAANTPFLVSVAHTAAGTPNAAQDVYVTVWLEQYQLVTADHRIMLTVSAPRV